MKRFTAIILIFILTSYCQIYADDSTNQHITTHNLSIIKADSLFKNYLPQSNFNDVKAAAEFYDSIITSFKNKDNTNLSKEYYYNAACSFYYHAIGLSEHDKIVDACRYYLKSLDIMEHYFEEDKLDYDKIIFKAKINTRIGQLFYDEMYYDIAITKYKETLRLIEITGSDNYKDIALKLIGNAFQLSNNQDSALYYYKESLRLSQNKTNILDIQKTIAQILYDKGYKDTAYMILKDNLDIIDDYEPKYSYHALLGTMYYEDNNYDSAIYYLEKSICSKHYYTKTLSAYTLSAIYDSIKNYDKKSYYDNIASKLSTEKIKNDINKKTLMSFYTSYINEKNQIDRKTIISRAIVIISIIIISIAIFSILARYRYKRKLNSLSTYVKYNKDEIDQLRQENKDKDILIKENQWVLMYKNGIIKSSKKIIREQERIINSQEKDIMELKNKIEENNETDINDFFNADICKDIISRICNVKKRKLKSNEIKQLETKDLIALRYAANKYLNNYVKRIVLQYPKLDNDDINCICLLLLDINITEISALLGKSYNSIWKRMDKLKSIFNTNANYNIHSYLIDYV